MAKAKDTRNSMGFFCKTSSNTELEPTIATLTGCQGGMPCGEYVELKGGYCDGGTHTAVPMWLYHTLHTSTALVLKE